jgi:hypothetical protein
MQIEREIAKRRASIKVEQRIAEQVEVQEAVRESNPDEFSQNDQNQSRHSLISEPNLNVSHTELMPKPKKVKKKKKKAQASKAPATHE